MRFAAEEGILRRCTFFGCSMTVGSVAVSPHAPFSRPASEPAAGVRSSGAPAAGPPDKNGSNPSAMSNAERLAALRALLVEHALDALIVPTEDAHQSEYVAPCDKRRQFISNFSGSAGTAVVTATEALLWTDGRYWLQAQQQLESSWTLMCMGDSSVPTVGEWLARHLPDARVGFDPSVTSVGTHRRLALEAGARCSLTPTPANLIDLLWTDRPARSDSPVIVHALEYAGRSVADKLASLRTSFASVGGGISAQRQCGAHVVTSLDCVAWLFNLRGDGIPFNPVSA
jgi:Xaa-Pro aminopeptidase